MKILLILGFMVKNNLALPDGKYIRSKGHDLEHLLKECNEIASDHNIQISLIFDGDNVKSIIVKFLSEYSKGGLRYYYIDSLSNISKADDPMVTWRGILFDIYNKHVKLKSKNKRDIESFKVKSLLSEMGEGFVLLSHGLDTNQLSLDAAFLEQSVIAESTLIVKSNVIELIKNLKGISDFLERECIVLHQKAGNKSPIIPYINEFLSIFESNTKYLTKKKKWL